MKFLKQCFALAGNSSNLLIRSLIFLFLQNFALILTFWALFYGFSALVLQTIPSSTINLILILCASFLVNFIFGWFASRGMGGLFYTLFRDYRLEVGQRLKKAPMGYFSDQRLSRILGCFTNVIRSLENFAVMSLQFTVNALSSAFFVLIGLTTLNVSLGLVSLVAMLICLIPLYFVYRFARVGVTQEHEALTNFNDALVEGISGTPVLRSFPAASQDTVQEIHSKIYETSRIQKEVLINFEFKFTVLSRIYGVCLYIASLIITLYGVSLYVQGALDLAATLTICSATFMLLMGLRQLENSSILLTKNPSNMDYLNSVLDIEEQVSGALSVSPQNKDIIFNHVNFGYSPSHPVLNDLSLHIAEGSRVALVGPSGSGKTTVINLLARFWDPDSGEITYGGHALKDYTTETLLRDLSLVFQDVYLFNDTIKNNIKFAKPDATDEEVITAAKLARCHEFISELSEGYDTVVGEGGSRLSGGEKQRISIARALLKDAPIILLDEATSSVDPENEYEILSGLEELCKGKTVISIAHRLSTVMHADKIFVIDNGRIVQQGTHTELLSQTDGLYAKFISARERASSWSLKR